MEFITISEKELTSPEGYANIRKNHLLISIRNPKQHVEIPATHYCKEVLEVEFLDIEDITKDSFNKGLARQILDFVNNHISEAEAIVVQCGAGFSRSVAVASALSKIINHLDDDVFSRGVPNMLVYVTMLDAYYEQNNKNKWSNIFYLRDKAMKDTLDPIRYRLWNYKVNKGN